MKLPWVKRRRRFYLFSDVFHIAEQIFNTGKLPGITGGIENKMTNAQYRQMLLEAFEQDLEVVGLGRK